MKIVIDIPEEAYKLLNSDKQIDWLGAEAILECVAKGTPYEDRPKGKTYIYNPKSCLKCKYHHDCTIDNEPCKNCVAYSNYADMRREE